MLSRRNRPHGSGEQAWLLGAAFLCCTSACADVEERDLAIAAEAIVYGRDDRVEPYATDDRAFAALAETRAVAIVARETAVVDGARNRASLAAPNLQEAAGVCADEPFADQPAAALCSGLLVTPELVLTAGHCTRLIGCDAMRLVIDYRYERSGQLASMEASDAFDCAEVVAQERDLPGEAERVDYAWIRLDRSALIAGAEPIDVRGIAEPLEEGEPLFMFGFPAGVPLKLDAGGRVADARNETLDYFAASTDSFYASSGSPIFDASLRLVGVQNRGAADFAPSAAGCSQGRRADDDASAQEQATYAFRAVDGLCAAAPEAPACVRDTAAPDSAPSASCAATALGARPTSCCVPILIVALIRLARLRRHDHHRRAVRTLSNTCRAWVR